MSWWRNRSIVGREAREKYEDKQFVHALLKDEGDKVASAARVAATLGAVDIRFSGFFLMRQGMRSRFMAQACVLLHMERFKGLLKLGLQAEW
jgi:hypothetical protein